MLLPDSILNQHYRITYVVDERADCVIYRASDQRDDGRVLIAALPQPNTDALEHAQNVARQVATIESAGLLPLRDHFVEDMTCYIVVADPGGQDLERTLRERGGPLPEALALQQLDRLLDVVDQLHSKKPELLLGELRSTDLWTSAEGIVSLAPFPLIRAINADPSFYRAPELHDPQTEPTTASDLYAIGTVAYQLLTGWAPPAAPLREAGTPLNSLRMLNPQVSVLAEQMVLRALEMRPANRYQAAREMRRAVDTVLLMGNRPLGAAYPSPPPVAPYQPQPPQQPGVAPPSQPLPPIVMPPGYGPTTPPSQPSSQPFPPAPGPETGGYGPLPPAPPQAGYPPPFGTPQPQYAGYPAAPQAPAAPRQSNTCLVAVVVVLAIMALAICVVGAYLLYLLSTGGSLSQVIPFGNAAGALPTAQATAAAPTAVPAPATGATAAPAQNANPAAISLANASSITETGQISATLLGPVFYSPDGQQLAIGVNRLIQLRNANTLEISATLEGHTGTVFTLAFSPLQNASDAPRLLASGAIDENTIRVWDVQTNRQVRELSGHTGWIRSLAFSPDGKLLASGSTDNTIKLWDAQNGTLLRTLQGHTDWLGGIAFSPDSASLASASRDGTVKLWEVANGTPRQDFKFETPLNPNTARSEWANSLAFSPDGKTIAVGSTDSRIYLLDATNGNVVRKLEGHTDWILMRGVVFSPDGKTLATCSRDGTVRLWNVETGAEQGQLNRESLQIISVSWNSDGRRLATSSDFGGEVLVWDVTTRNPIQSARIGQGLVTSLAYSDDGRVLGTGGINGMVYLHLLAENRRLTFPGGAPTFQYLAFLGDSQLAVLNDSGQVIIVNLSGQQQPETLSGLDGLAFSLNASADRKLVAAGGESGKITLWDAQSKQRLRILEGLGDTISRLAFSADGQKLVAATNARSPEVGIWDVQSGALRGRFVAHDAPLSGMAVQPNGRLIVTTGRDGIIRFWDVNDGSSLRSAQLPQEQGWFSSVAFSPDGTLLVTGSSAGAVQFWNPGTGDVIHTFSLQNDNILALAFRADGEELAVSTLSGGVRLLSVKQ